MHSSVLSAGFLSQGRFWDRGSRRKREASSLQGPGKFLCTEAWELQLPLSLQRPCLNKETTAVPIHAVSVARYGWASSAWFFSLFSRGRDGAGGALLVLGDLSNQLDSALTADSLG